MLVFNIIFSLTIFNIIERHHCLVELTSVEDNNIIRIAAIIRNATNTLQDYNNLKEIAKLTRVNGKNINNTEQNFMTIINEAFYEDDLENNIITNEDNDDIVVKHIELFLNNLENYKTLYKVNDINIGINNDILQYFNNELPYNNSKANWKEENVDVLDDLEYWDPEQSGRRIFNGKTTKVKYYPFVSSIEVFRKFQCAGSIIKSDLIITASSCLQLAWNNRLFRENPAFLSARVGSNFYESGGESIPVLEVYFHPTYDPKRLLNNICILRLIRKLHFSKNKHIRKINFDRHDSSLPMSINGVTIVGWGAKGPSSVIHNPWRNRISYAILDIYPLNECQEIYSREYVSSKNFCAGFVSRGGGACNRDVGGPGIAGGKLIGIISFGSPVCGTPDVPTVFTKIGYYTDWIEDIMAQDVPYIKKRTTTTISPILTDPNPYTPSETTTFKLEPIVGKMKPIPINRPMEENLRDNGDLFKDFLKTMFTSKEVEQYHDQLDNLEDQPILESAIEKPTKARHVPKDEDSTEDYVVAVTEKHMKYTVLDGTNDAKEIGLERDIVNLIEDLDMNEIVGNDESVEAPEETASLLKILQSKNPPSNIKSNVDDAILTLLYLSDDEAKNANNPSPPVGIEVDDNNDSGLSIAVNSEDTFKDFTYRNNGSDVIDFIISD